MMRTKKQWGLGLAVLLALAVMASACGGNNGNNSSSGTNEQNTENQSGGDQANTDQEVELIVAYPAFGTISPDIGQISEEISKITKEKINATVKLTPISFGTWVQQMNLMMSGGEKLDVVVGGLGQFGTQVASGQLRAIDDLVEQYAQDAVAQIGADFVEVSKVEGKLYGLPSIHEYAVGYGALFVKEVAERYQIDVDAIRNLDDLEAALALIKEKEPNIAPLAFNNRSTLPTGYLTIDNLGDSFGVVMNNDPNLQVVNLFETPEYEEAVKRMRKWYLAGYINKDAATYQGNTNDFIKSGRAYVDVTTTKPGQAENSSLQVGKEMVLAQLKQPFSATGNIITTLWSIPEHAQHPERSMAMINLLYTDPDIMNLLTWGIENKHYVKKSDQIIAYPEGVTAGTVTYNASDSSWLYGNQFLTYIMEGGDPELWNKYRELNETAVKSSALGFSFNPENVKTEITALTNVVTQYKSGLETGALDSDKTLPEFNSKLKDAGLDKVIQEKQRQLDEWKASK